MTTVATNVSMASTSYDEKPKKKGKKKYQKLDDINQVDLLSLFFAQYQTFEERFQLRPTTTTTTTTTYEGEDEPVLLEQTNVEEKMKKKDKGKEKMTEEEEQAAREEEESGEEGLLIDSLHEDEDEDDTSLDLFSDDLHCFDDVFFDDQDEAEAYLDLFDDDVEAELYFNHYNLPDLDHYAGIDFDMVETDDYVALEVEGESWERRVVSSKLGGHVVRRHSRSHKKPRVRPGRWVNARDERKRCERFGLVFEQVCAYKANATRGLEYRTIDYQAIRQDIVIPSYSTSSSSSSSSSTTSKPATRTTTRSSSANDGRVPSYEREVTSAIDRGSVVQCGLSAQQLNDLLNRELTPEDYELLLMLDSTVKPKTLSTNLIDSFPSRTVESGSALVEGDGERCAICMCSFEVGEGVKELPRCQHCFHAECIVQWLSTASTKCPLCGCSLES